MDLISILLHVVLTFVLILYVSTLESLRLQYKMYTTLYSAFGDPIYYRIYQKYLKMFYIAIPLFPISMILAISVYFTSWRKGL